MLTDGVSTRKQQGKAAEQVRVADISDLLLRSVRGPGDGGPRDGGSRDGGSRDGAAGGTSTVD
jgi:hypothetical protein